MLRTKPSEPHSPTNFVDFEIPNGNVIPGEWCGCCLTANLALQSENGSKI